MYIKYFYLETICLYINITPIRTSLCLFLYKKYSNLYSSLSISIYSTPSLFLHVYFYIKSTPIPTPHYLSQYIVLPFLLLSVYLYITSTPKSQRPSSMECMTFMCILKNRFKLQGLNKQKYQTWIFNNNHLEIYNIFIQNKIQFSRYKLYLRIIYAYSLSSQKDSILFPPKKTVG